jgi:hypothetical protein
MLGAARRRTERSAVLTTASTPRLLDSSRPRRDRVTRGDFRALAAYSTTRGNLAMTGGS